MKSRITLSLILCVVLLCVTFVPVQADSDVIAEGNFDYRITDAGAEVIKFYHSGASLVQIPDTVQGYPVVAVGDGVFKNVHGITQIVLPQTLQTIGQRAFYACFDLEQISLPQGLVAIGEMAFSNCYALQAIVIPANVQQIGMSAFSNCTSLKSLQVDAENVCFTAADNVLFSADMTTLFAYPNAKEDTTYRIPDQVRVIGEKAFQECTSLQSIVLPAGLVEIEKYAFSGCAELLAVQIPDSVSKIGTFAFSNCDKLTVAVLGSGIASVPAYAFHNCGNLTGISVPSGVTSIGNSAFNNCAKLTHVAYGGKQSQWDLVSIGSGNALLTGQSIHFETLLQWAFNCIESGVYCPACQVYITKTVDPDAKHTYTDESDISCNACTYVQPLRSISISQLPHKLQYDSHNHALDVTGGMLQAYYEDGAVQQLAMTTQMVSGFDNTKLGQQQLTVTVDGKTAAYTVQVVPGKPAWVEISSQPITVDYLVGEAPDMTGLSLNACYADGQVVSLSFDQITVEMPDLNAPGIKAVRVGFKDVYTVCKLYVHGTEFVALDKSTYPQSKHNYSNYTDESKTFTSPGALNLVLTFSTSSYVESGYDYVYVYDGAGALLAQYTGSLSGKSVTVPGDTFTVRLYSDRGVNYYGYSFETIVAETISHSMLDGQCSICRYTENTVGGFVNGRYQDFDTLEAALAAGAAVKLFANTQVQLELQADLYIDLNGYDLTGTIVTNGFSVYGMDSTTDGYTCEQTGLFACTDEAGLAVVPVTHFKSAVTGAIKRYMAIQEENGYSFHRFYLGITHMNLRPATLGIGYKAVFHGDYLVRAQLDSQMAFGYTLQVEGFDPVSAYMASSRVVSGKTVTLRIDNYNVDRYGQALLSAKVFIILKNGVVVESQTCAMTMRSMLETLNNAVLTDAQLAAIRSLILQYPVIKTWDTENLFAQ